MHQVSREEPCTTERWAQPAIKVHKLTRNNERTPSTHLESCEGHFCVVVRGWVTRGMDGDAVASVQGVQELKVVVKSADPGPYRNLATSRPNALSEMTNSGQGQAEASKVILNTSL